MSKSSSADDDDDGGNAGNGKSSRKKTSGSAKKKSTGTKDSSYTKSSSTKKSSGGGEKESTTTKYSSSSESSSIQKSPLKYSKDGSHSSYSPKPSPPPRPAAKKKIVKRKRRLKRADWKNSPRRDYHPPKPPPPSPPPPPPPQTVQKRKSSDRKERLSLSPKNSPSPERRLSSQKSNSKDEDDKYKSNSVMNFICKLLKSSDCSCQTKSVCVQLPDPSVPPGFRKGPRICFFNDHGPKSHWEDPYFCGCDDPYGYGCGCLSPYSNCMSPYSNLNPCCWRSRWPPFPYGGLYPWGFPSPICIRRNPYSSCDDSSPSAGKSEPNYNNCNFYMNPKDQKSSDCSNGWQKENAKGGGRSRNPGRSPGRSVNYRYRSASPGGSRRR